MSSKSKLLKYCNESYFVWESRIITALIKFDSLDILQGGETNVSLEHLSVHQKIPIFFYQETNVLSRTILTQTGLRILQIKLYYSENVF